MNPTFAFAEVKTVETENPDGAFQAVLSMPTLDRDREIIDANAFAPLPDRITIDVDHGMSTASTVGSGRPYYDGDVLKIDGTFSSIPRAQEVRTLVKEGHVPAMSVAFMGAERVTGEDGVTHITRAELLNAAFVPIPSNREAAVLAIKSGARNSQADADRMQTIHDLSVANGAACEGKHAHGETKSTDTDHDDAAAAVIVPDLGGTVTARARAIAAEAALI